MEERFSKYANDKYGPLLNAVSETCMQFKEETMESVANIINRLTEEVECQTSGQREPNKLDKIERYIHLLHDAQRSGHEVHKEIDEALKQFKLEAGI